MEGYKFEGSVETESQAQYFVDKYRKEGKAAKFKKVATFPGHIYQIFVKPEKVKSYPKPVAVIKVTSSPIKYKRSPFGFNK